MKTWAGTINQRVCDTAINASTMPAIIPSTVENSDSTSVLTRPVHSSDGSDSVSNCQSRKFCKNAFMARSRLSVGSDLAARFHRVRREVGRLRVARMKLQVELQPGAVG